MKERFDISKLAIRERDRDSSSTSEIDPESVSGGTGGIFELVGQICGVSNKVVTAEGIVVRIYWRTAMEVSSRGYEKRRRGRGREREEREEFNTLTWKEEAGLVEKERKRRWEWKKDVTYRDMQK